MVCNALLDGVSKIKDYLQPMEDDFDRMENELVMREADQKI